MERKVGEIFTYADRTYKVVKGTRCINCDINGHCVVMVNIIGPCVDDSRSDNTNIVFKEVNNMEIKNNQLTIEIPEGMEIDIENSDLAKGIIKFKVKSIIYKDIEDALNLKGNRTSVAVDKNNAYKLSAIDKLMNIARFYNGKEKLTSPYSRKYFIYYDSIKNIFEVDYNEEPFTGDLVYFIDKTDAYDVIDNTNFRDILDTIYKE